MKAKETKTGKKLKPGAQSTLEDYQSNRPVTKADIIFVDSENTPREQRDKPGEL